MGIVLSFILCLVFNKFPKFKGNIYLILIVFIGLYLRLCYVFLTPTFYAPDEQSHYNYAKYLAENKELPIQTSKTNEETNDWEYYQPPLYYSLIAPIYVVIQPNNKKLDTYGTVLAMRLFSVVLWIMTIYFSYKTLQLFNFNNTFLETFVISMLSLLPSYTYLSSMINNDNLLTCLGSIILYLSFKEMNLKNTLLIGLFLGLAMLTKLSAVIFFIYFIISIIYNLFNKGIASKQLAKYSIMIIIGFLIWLPIGLRNYNVYGSFTAENIANIPYHWESFTYAFYSTLLYIQKSFWAISGIHNNLSSIFPVFGMILFLASLIGFIYNVVNKGKNTFYSEKNKRIIQIFGITILVHLILIFRFGLLFAQSQGRFLFPLLLPIAIIIGLGLLSIKFLNKEKSHIYMSYFFIAYSISFAIYSLMKFDSH